MKHLRTAITAACVLALAAAATALIAEAIGAIDDTWRHRSADAVTNTFEPSQPGWQATLLAIGFTAALLVVVASEFSRPPKGARIMHNVHSAQDGNTRITGKAAMRAATRELEHIDGVTNATATITKKTLTLTIRVDDRVSLEAVEEEARQRLDHEFWINLGLADFATNLLITHDPKPPRVR